MQCALRWGLHPFRLATTRHNDNILVSACRIAPVCAQDVVLCGGVQDLTMQSLSNNQYDLMPG